MADWLEGLEGLEGFEALEGNVGIFGIAAGIGAALLAPVVLPVLGKAGKPMVKAVVKEGMWLYEKGKEALTEMNDAWEDIVAEVQYEMHQPEEPQSATSRGPENIPVED
ncbi:MAG: hypothetical protein OHK0047_38580 [Leptolyngbyaceae cyanobacterium]|uniref:DUF5132 domain-containing protein n=1 Tax=Leptodesmis sichuanensis TaxID=2906798 RepID=UPI001F232DDB|nr:DUF5132 domain-containing protein [Leptodesmis sichuanensis]UIE38519.1 DUF5132 domain-containing protein [Leptodesmis sichuanensis A121]